MTGKLARVHWQMGQALLPQHFLAQEEALLSDSIARFQLKETPQYGVAALKWNESLLIEGVLSLTAATVVLPSGLLLDVPNNATATPVNLNVPAAARVVVYMHYLGPASARDESQQGWQDVEQEIPRVTNRVALSVDQNHPEALASLRLAEFDRDPEGLWTLSPRYIPPLLRLGTTPFLAEVLMELPQAVEAFQFKLVQDSASYLSGSGLQNVKQCLKSVYRFRRFLANLGGEIHLHPYDALEALKEFYIDVCFYRDSIPKHIADPYVHDELAGCFARVLKPLKEQMQLAATRSPYQSFTFENGVYQIELSSEAQQAKAIYFLVQKRQVNRTVKLEDFKLASPSRLALVHKLALQGVPIKPIDRPLLAQSFGPEVDFYEVLQGEEWDHAVREGRLVFYHSASMQDLEFYLYWHFG